MTPANSAQPELRAHPVPRDDDMLQGVPDQVVRVQDALAARSRLVVIRRLLEGPATFGTLAEQLPVSLAGIRAALQDLAALGYVSDDSPDGRQRKPTTAVFTIDRDMVLRDAAELLLFLSR